MLKKMATKDKDREGWAARCDSLCLWCAALIPCGIVIGNVAFEALLALAGVVWIVRALLFRDNPLRRAAAHPLVLPWWLWFTVIVASVVWNGPGSKGWGHDAAFVRYVLFGTALLDVGTRRSLGRHLVAGLAAGVLFAAVNTLMAYGLGWDMVGRPLVRYTGKLKEASRISGIVTFAAPFLLGWGVLDARLSAGKKCVLLGLGAVAFAQLLQTQVRTALMGALAGSMFFLFFGIAGRARLRGALLLGGLLVGAAGAAFYFRGVGHLDSFYDRIYYWKVAWAMWQDHPLLGVGISSFQDAYTRMAESGRVSPFLAPDGQVFALAEQTHAHNLFMMVLSSTGALGLAAFAWLFVRAVGLVFDKPSGWRFGLVSWPVVFFAVGLTGFNIYHSWYQALLAFFLVLLGCRRWDRFPSSPAQICVDTPCQLCSFTERSKLERFRFWLRNGWTRGE